VDLAEHVGDLARVAKPFEALADRLCRGVPCQDKVSPARVEVRT